LKETHLTVQLSKILEFRNDEVTLRTSQAMRDNLEVLSRIALQSARIAEQAQKDSKILKALSVIATIYLPASLVAVRHGSHPVELSTCSLFNVHSRPL
jgi:hypothetical protein